MVQPVVVDQINGHHDWIVPRRVMCAFFWVGIILLFTGIILLVTSKHRGNVYRSWGSLTLGLGFCLLMICFILCLHAYCVITVEEDDSAKAHSPVHPPAPAALVNGHAPRNTSIPRTNNPPGTKQGLQSNPVKPIQVLIVDREAQRGVANTATDDKVVTYIPGEDHVQVEKEATKAPSLDSAERNGPPIYSHYQMPRLHQIREESPEADISCTASSVRVKEDDPDVRPKLHSPPSYKPGSSEYPSETTPLRAAQRSVTGHARVAPSTRDQPQCSGECHPPAHTTPRLACKARVTELPAGGATGSTHPPPTAHPVPLYAGRRHSGAVTSAHVHPTRSKPLPHSHSRPTPNSLDPVREPGPKNAAPLPHSNYSNRVFRPIQSAGGSRPLRDPFAPEEMGEQTDGAEEGKDLRSVVYLDPLQGITESKVSIYDNVQYINV